MAKDRRNKVRPTLDLESELGNSYSSNTSRSSATSRTPERKTKTEQRSSSDTQAPSRKRKKKKKISRAALILRWVLVVLVITVLVFLGVLANYIYQAMFVVDTGEKVPPISPTEYDVTPVDKQDDVAYYLFGILGEDADDDTSMVAVVCHDKQKKTVNVLKLPEATYLDKGELWAVDTVGAVFANPKALDWCDVCKKRVYEPEILEGEVATHTVCSTEITLKKGSAVSGLVDFVNDQLGLPVDHYFMLPEKAMSLLVDLVGGVDVELGGYYELGGTSYDAGVQTLPGAAAMDYVTSYDGTFGSDVTRMIRQREVFGALLTRMFRLEDAALKEEIVEELMDSSAAVRTDCTADEISEILLGMKEAGVAGITTHILPGETATDADGDAVFTAHKDELLTLIGASFNPYGEAITAADLLIPELIHSGAADTRSATLDTFTVEQTGKLLDTETE